MDLTRRGEILLEEDKVSTNHTTPIFIRPTEVKVPEDFWVKEELVMAGDQEAPEAVLSNPQTFDVTLTDEDLP
ncbi:hypothetical protein LIER_03239 [Lithospermum erythrorhizon]|uniref:Uncharacterized protein n=1 Tax=Lithospermum erythrorhizon TaxID=34254 RepID=A0AAV3NTY0_LITER